MSIKDEILESQTVKGGWTRRTLTGWGVTWPPPEGWKERLERLEALRLDMEHYEHEWKQELRFSDMAKTVIGRESHLRNATRFRRDVLRIREEIHELEKKNAGQ